MQFKNIIKWNLTFKKINKKYSSSIVRCFRLTKAFKKCKALISIILLELQCKFKNIVKKNLMFKRIKIK